MGNIVYSIIIPHKDTPSLLQRCLNSIPQRADLEVIVVDDNSDPKIVDFSNFPGINTPLTKVVFSKAGKGAGYARNIGIDNANGKWLLFADADDFFYTDRLNAFLDVSIPDTEDIVVYRADYIYLDGTRRELGGYGLANDEKIHESKDLSRLYLDCCVPWVKMVRREKLINEGIRFEEILWGNDMRFSALLALTTPQYAIVNIKLYRHERRPGSLVETTNNYSAYNCRINSMFRINKLLRKHNRPLLPTEYYLLDLYKTKGYIYLLFFLLKSLFYNGVQHTIIEHKHIRNNLPFHRMKRRIKKIIKRILHIEDKANQPPNTIDYYLQLGVKIGENVSIIDPISPVIFSSEPYLVSIGDNTTISFDVAFVTHDAATRVIRNLPDGDPETVIYGPISVGKNCFIGCRSTILANVTIGDNSIIGAGSVVNRDIPANTVAAGCPCRVICTLEEYRNKHKDDFLYMVALDYDSKREYLENHFQHKLK